MNNKFISEENDCQKHQMQTILTSDKLNKQIKEKINNYKTIKLLKVSESVIEASNKIIKNKLIKFKKFETFFKIFVFENKKLDVIKKIHDQFAIKHFEKCQIV